MSDQVRASIDPLESRELLSTVVLSNNTLNIRADNTGNHSIVIREAKGSKLAVSIDGGAEKLFNDSDVNAVIAFGGNGGNNLIAVSQRLRHYTIRTDFIASRSGNDTLIGGDGRSVLVAGNGNCLLQGGNADNTLVGGIGRDTLLGGPAFDLIIAGRGHTYINAGNGQNIVFGGQRGDTIIGGDFRDQIFGSTSDDYIQLGSGNETVYGDGGNDTIKSGSGTNEIHRSLFRNLTKVIHQLMPDIPK